MNNSYKIETLGTGSKFTYGGISWILLQKTKTDALCLAEKVILNKAFDDGGNNNWAESNLRSYLNGEYLDTVEAAGADKAAFLPMTVELTSEDGLKDYSVVTDKLTLITCDQYRKHRYTIPNAKEWWWTVTPWSVASNGYSHYVRFVTTSGALNDNNVYIGNGGVRPLCNLNSSILVSVTDLKDYTPEEYPEESASKMKKCGICGKSLDTGVVVHRECLDNSKVELDKINEKEIMDSKNMVMPKKVQTDKEHLNYLIALSGVNEIKLCANEISVDLVAENMMLKEEVIILKKYKDTVEPFIESIQKHYERLTHENYSLQEQLDKVIALPCGIDDDVYVLGNQNAEITTGTIVAFHYSKCATENELLACIALFDDGLTIHDFKHCINSPVKQLSKTWFLTREQAVERLKELQK